MWLNHWPLEVKNHILVKILSNTIMIIATHYKNDSILFDLYGKN